MGGRRGKGGKRRGASALVDEISNQIVSPPRPSAGGMCSRFALATERTNSICWRSVASSAMWRAIEGPMRAMSSRSKASSTASQNS